MKYLRTTSLFIALCISCIALAGCGGPSAGSSTGGSSNTAPFVMADDVCADFPVDFVYSALGKTIVRIEPSKLPTVHACDYYYEWKEDWTSYQGKNLAGGRGVGIVLEDQVGTQRARDNMGKLGLTVTSDPRIPGDNAVGTKQDGSIWSINLKVDDQRYVYISLLSSEMTNDEYVAFAAKVAERMLGTSKLEIKTNPGMPAQTSNATTGASSDQNKSDAASSASDAKSLARSFLEAIGKHDIDGALKMMDADMDTKQAWGVNFNSLESLSISSLEPVYQEEWTSVREIYIAQLDVKVKPNVQTWGWENGKNTRWISVEKTSRSWIIHELANNP